MKSKRILSFITAMSMFVSTLALASADILSVIPASADTIEDGAINITALNNGESVKLPEELVGYYSVDPQYQLVYNEKQNGIYFIALGYISKKCKINFLSLNDGSYSTVFDVDKDLDLYECLGDIADQYDEIYSFNKSDSFVQNGKLYILDSLNCVRYAHEGINSDYGRTYRHIIIVYDLDKGQVSEVQVLNNDDGKYYDQKGVSL